MRKSRDEEQRKQISASDVSQQRRARLYMLCDAKLNNASQATEEKETRPNLLKRRRKLGRRRIRDKELIAFVKNARKSVAAVTILLFCGTAFGVVRLALTNSSDQSSQQPIQDQQQTLRTITSAQDVLLSYAKSTSVEEKIAHVWNPNRIAPLLRAHEASKPPSKPIGVRIVSERSRHPQLGLPGSYALGAITDDIGVIDDIILRHSGSQFLVDWEASVGYNEVRLSRLLQDRSPDPVQLRVLIAQANYYNFDFEDEQRFQSYALKVEDDSEPRCFAFVERASATGEQLSELFQQNSNRTIAATLMVRFPHGKDAVGEITRILAPHWCFPAES